MIKTFIKRYQVNLNEALFSNIDDYPHFNSFFIRHLQPAARPVTTEPHAIACPADGSISQIGRIEKDLLFQAKKFYYRLDELLASSDMAKLFYEGQFATIYLSPRDYHRVHMPLTGTLRETIFVPGKLFSVNQETAAAVPNLFARNERLICLFDTAIGPMAVILVGAMLVGSMKTVWKEKPYVAKQIQRETFSLVDDSQKIFLKMGDELGNFEMGSTVILLFPENKVEWEKSHIANSIVSMGRTFGYMA